METPEQMRENTRAVILETALELFAEKGYHGAKMAEISKRAGISSGLAYHYFKGKEEILDAVLERSEELHKPLLLTLKQGRTGEGARLFESIFSIISENTNFLRLNIALLLQPRVLNAKKNSLSRFFSRLLRVIRTNFRAGEIEQPELEAQLLLCIILGMITATSLEKPKLDLEKLIGLLKTKYE